MLMMIGLCCWRRWLLSESRVGWKFAKYSLRKGSAKIVWQRPEWKANRQQRQSDNSNNNNNKGTTTATTTGIVLQLLLLLLLLLMLRFENRTGQFYFYHGMQFIYKMVRGSFPLPLWVLKKNNSNNNNNDWQIIMNNYHRQTTIIKITATATRQRGKQNNQRNERDGNTLRFSQKSLWITQWLLFAKYL